MKISQREKRVLIFHEYKLGSKITKATNNITKSIDDRAVSRKTVQNWFNKFKNGILEIDDFPRSGRPETVNRDYLKNIVKEDPRITTRKIAENLHCSQKIVSRALNNLGIKYKYGVTIPHSLSQKQLQIRTDICISLITLKLNNNWPEFVITGDEKWVMYVNHKHKKQ